MQKEPSLSVKHAIYRGVKLVRWAKQAAEYFFFNLSTMKYSLWRPRSIGRYISIHHANVKHSIGWGCQEFHDALALQYKKPLLNLPPYCDGCGAVFSVEHALDCRVGSLVGQRHNEVHDAIGDFDFLAWGQVQKEPVICEDLVRTHYWWFTNSRRLTSQIKLMGCQRHNRQPTKLQDLARKTARCWHTSNCSNKLPKRAVQ